MQWRPRAEDVTLAGGDSSLVSSALRRRGRAATGLRSLLFRLDDADGLSVNQRVGRVLDDLVGDLKAGDDLDGSAVVATDGDGDEFGYVVLDQRHPQAF